MPEDGESDRRLPAETPPPSEKKPVVDESAEEPEEPEDEAGKGDAVAPLRSTVEELEARLTELEERLDDHERRSERERDQLARQSVEQFAERMLTVKDTIDSLRALEGLDEDSQRRVDLLGKQFEKQFTAGAVERVDTGGQFDATRHRMVERVSLAEANESAAAEYDDGDIVAEREPGYVLGERVLRPARVVVAKAERDDEAGQEVGNE